MSLETYNEKRNFGQTPEPKGETQKRSRQLRFVVQRHQASTLHYDFRLEVEGVLKSWAVPKGPSLNPADKRLAMEVEDHPLGYRTFEGDIPEGQYGAGHVDIWDEGTYHAADAEAARESEKLLVEGLRKGSISFVLEGKKLQGAFSLVKMKGRQKGAWLLLKKDDATAVSEAYNSEDHLEGVKGAAAAPTAARKPIAGTGARPENGSTKTSAAEREVEGKAGAKQKNRKSAADDRHKIERKIGKQPVLLSSLDKPYWPEEGITKGDLIDYYQSIADVLLPYLKDRAQSLFRFPNGIAQPGFVQKDIHHTPDWVRTLKLRAESTGELVEYLVCDNKATLAYMNNLGCIQLNPWNSRMAQLDKPDYMVLDLDPGENTYDEVVEVALVTKAVLDKAGATAFAKTSGATGMHIFVPLGAMYSFAEVKKFAHRVAQLVHAQLPGLTSLERSPKERRKQVYLDYLQNAIGQTIASVYTVRPMPGAPVSAPLLWEEVKPGLSPKSFTMQNMPARIENKGDLFKGVLGKGVDLDKCWEQLEHLPGEKQKS